MQLCFVIIEKNDAPGLKGANLDNDLRPNRSPCARDKDRLVVQERFDGCGIDSDGLPADQILDTNVFKGFQFDVGFREIVQPGNHLDRLDLLFLGCIVQGAEFLVVQGWNGDNDRLDVVLGDGFGQRICGTQNLDPMQIGAPLRRIVVQKAYGFERRESLPHHVAIDHLARIARADDQGPLTCTRCFSLGKHLQIQPLGDPEGGNEKQGDDHVGGNDPLREAAQGCVQEGKGRKSQQDHKKPRQEQGQDKIDHVEQADVAPSDFIDSEKDKGGELDGDEPGHGIA